jgi:glycosyltransferase involved in cell wall biosynthesis
MKIALVTHSFLPNSIGGREKYIYDLARMLIEKGNEVKVFTCSDSILKKSFYTKNSLVIDYLPTLRFPLLEGIYRIPLMFFLRLLKKDFDLIHAHDFHHFTTFISTVATKIINKPLIVTEHGYPEQVGLMKGAMSFFDTLFLPRIKNSSRKIIAVSNFIKNELVSKYNIPKKKIEVIYNSIILKEYKEKSEIFKEKYKLGEDKVILSVGRVIKEKGFQYLIKALPIILKKIKNVKIVIIGPPSQFKNTLVSLAKKIGVENKIVFCGVVSDEMLKSALYCSDIVAIPSLYEPFGIVALEAMAYSKPIVASKVGGLMEIIIHNQNGLLVQPENSFQLANAIIRVLEDKNLAKKLGRRARECVKRYDWNRNIYKILKVYEEIIY